MVDGVVWVVLFVLVNFFFLRAEVGFGVLVRSGVLGAVLC